MAENEIHSEIMSQESSVGKGEITLFLFLGIETVLFGALVSAFLLLRTDQPVWNPHLSFLYRLIFPGLNTLLILFSAWVASRAVSGIRRNDRSAVLLSMQTSLLMGLLFITIQFFDFSHSGMAINDPGFGGAFFALICFHAVHVLAGVILIGLNVIRVRLGDFNPSQYSPIRIGAWFWYYVTFVWLVLFALLYLV